MAGRKHPVTFRTRKLSFPAPMVLHSGGCGRVGHRRTIFVGKGSTHDAWGPFCVTGSDVPKGSRPAVQRAGVVCPARWKPRARVLVHRLHQHGGEHAGRLSPCLGAYRCPDAETRQGRGHATRIWHWLGAGSARRAHKAGLFGTAANVQVGGFGRASGGAGSGLNQWCSWAHDFESRNQPAYPRRTKTPQPRYCLPYSR